MTLSCGRARSRVGIGLTVFVRGRLAVNSLIGFVSSLRLGVFSCSRRSEASSDGDVAPS